MKLVVKESVKTDKFITLFKNLQQVCDTVTIQFTEDKMYIQSMDSHHVCMVEIQLSNEWFDTYEIDSDDINTISTNTSIFQCILKCKDQSQQITMQYSGDPDTLDISFTEGETGTFDKYFEMPLITIEHDVLHVPSESEWEAEIEIKSSIFQTLTSEMNLFSDEIIVECREDDCSMKTSGINGSYNINCNVENLESYSIDEDTTIQAKYSLAYFGIVGCFSKLNELLHLELSNQLPVKMTYNLGDDANDEDNYVRFYLAPKIVDDE